MKAIWKVCVCVWVCLHSWIDCFSFSFVSWTFSPLFSSAKTPTQLLCWMIYTPSLPLPPFFTLQDLDSRSKSEWCCFLCVFPTNLELHQSIVFYWRWHIVFVFLSCWYFLLTTEVASFSCTPVNNQSGFSPDKHSLRCTSMSVLIIIPTLYLLSDSRVRRIMVPTTCCTRLVLRAGDLLLHRSFSSIYLKGQKEKYKSAHRRREMEKWRKK